MLFRNIMLVCIILGACSSISTASEVNTFDVAEAHLFYERKHAHVFFEGEEDIDCPETLQGAAHTFLEILLHRSISPEVSRDQLGQAINQLYAMASRDPELDRYRRAARAFSEILNQSWLAEEAPNPTDLSRS